MAPKKIMPTLCKQLGRITVQVSAYKPRRSLYILTNNLYAHSSLRVQGVTKGVSDDVDKPTLLVKPKSLSALQAEGRKLVWAAMKCQCEGGMRMNRKKNCSQKELVDR
ncbi:hypothetical protein CYLTODRAFT_265320 [Cylindrobasidium torrendii FP15055 ss-10]|uniref:Uncharacterized protein n=1 Tax=Cylindrobasidium torrendii FP15055 ss-10 TaxID=1314674 RepID=A0A0D7BCQ8_9AGAR|nr:hypothetical protein CYLTODRAFT_265320 [Cylindrobasidium torrendii FP15055 ss-10]